MLAHDARRRPPAVAGDACRLPFADATFAAVVAAFSLNHLTEPARGLAEAARVIEPGGGLVASAYADDDTHPAKEAVEAAVAARGWVPEPWYRSVRADAIPRLATVERAAAAAAALTSAVVEHVRLPVPGLGGNELVAWRLGLAHVRTFVSGLSPAARADVVADALDRLGPQPADLVRSIILVTWRKPA
jgi:SAM-dependent methyltransferase